VVEEAVLEKRKEIYQAIQKVQIGRDGITEATFEDEEE